MEITKKERLEIFKIEMGLIQATLDKYDDLIFRNRNWFITLWMGTIGLGFTLKSEWFPVFAVLLSILYWFIEGMMRHQYWYKYVLRYRVIREHINMNPPDLESLSLYDLTNHFSDKRVSKKEMIKKSFFKLEPSIVYGGMALCASVIWSLIMAGVIEFTNNL